MSTRRSVIFIVPHPDDLAYGMGGTAYLLKEKYKLHELCLTKGERALSAEVSHETAAIMEKEAAAARKILNTDLTFLGLIDGEVFAGRKICERVAEIIRQINPAAIFGLWPIDYHPDHSAAAEIARKAFFLSQVKAEFYMCEEDIIQQTTQFDPDLYVDISRVIENKIALLRCFECQNRDDSMVKLSLKQFAFRGYQAGCKYAEGFKTIRPPMTIRQSILFDLGEKL